MKTIWAHTLVKNERRFVWYSVMSIINHVDKVLLWDTGSTDGTKTILKEIKKRFSEKVELKFLDNVSPDQFTDARQKMLEETKSDWFLVVDGDEIWWDDSIKRVVKLIQEEGDSIESIVVPTISLVGDIYHYQEEAAGQYSLAGRKGHLALRGVNRRIPGLFSNKPHGTWGWVDGEGKMIQERRMKKIKFVDAPYFHVSFLERAGERSKDLEVPKRERKLKYEIGILFARDYYYPEVFFRERPSSLPSPWRVMDQRFFRRALIETPLRKLKRRLVVSKSGY